MTQGVRKGAEQVGKEKPQKQLPHCQTSPKHAATGQSRDLRLERRRWWWPGVSRDRGLSRMGRKEGWSLTGQPRGSGQIQPAAFPSSNCLQLLPSSSMGST